MFSQIPSYRFEFNYNKSVLDLLEIIEEGLISGTVKPPSISLRFLIVLMFVVKIVSFGSWKQICPPKDIFAAEYTGDGCISGGA